MIEQELAKVRTQIDCIDKQVYALIKQRGELAAEVAKIKQKNPHALYYRPEREAQILRKIMAENDSLLSDRAMAQIFRDIMTACLALQKNLTIAYLGPQGTFCQMATEQHFGKAIVSQAVPSIDDVFQLVESKQVHYGVVPVENSSEGMVNITLDSFLNSSVQIIGEIELRINHQFMRHKNAPEEVTKIFSHQQSFAQCHSWLKRHYANVELVEVSSNSEAALKASQDPLTAAISSELSAELYELNILQHNIEDHRLNSTRFIILGQQSPPPSGNDKTSLVISTPHKPGSLLSLLQPFENNAINMTMIESRPYRQRNWSYLFFIDIEGHQQDESVKKALSELAQMSVMMTILGSYPKAIS